LGAGVAEGVLVTWLYDDGAHVREGEPIAEIMIEKAQLEVVAPASGTLRILVPRESVIRPGMSLGEIRT
jgi:pyruvate/2-oxoglutarate dehydrogenase complex dihydrolipoamide acyltransferase (E2) component